MKRSSHRLLATAALFAACVGIAPLAGADDKNATAPPAADQADSRVPTPPAGKGQVIFFRPLGDRWWPPISVHEGNRGVTTLGVNQYSIYVTDPGPHTFSIQYGTKVLHIEVEAGETYYVIETQTLEWDFNGRTHLTWSDAAVFTMMKRLKLSGEKPADLKPSADAESGTH